MYELIKKRNKIYYLKIITLSCFLFFCLFLFETKTTKAFLGSAECASKGGSCDFTCFSGDYESLGMCDYGVSICCRKKLVDTSGADPDPIGAGIGTGGVLQDPNVTPGPGSLGSGVKGGTVTPGTSGIPTPTTATSPVAASPSGGSGETGGLVPCTNNCTLCHLVLGFKNIYDYLLILLLSATTLVVVIAGVMYMVSSGDKGMIDKAKSALTYALTAMILALTAWLIINATLSALGYTKVGSWYNFTCDTAQTQGPTGGTGVGTLPGTGGTGGKTGYPSGGNASATAQDVIKNYMAMDGKIYGAPFPLDAKLAGTGEGMNCGSTCREAWMEAGLPDFWNLQKQRWDGDPNSLKPGDICLFDKSATGIDHAFMILNQNGMTTAAGGSSNTIRTSANGLDYNISKLNGNSQGLYVFHIADYTK